MIIEVSEKIGLLEMVKRAEHYAFSVNTGRRHEL